MLVGDSEAEGWCGVLWQLGVDIVAIFWKEKCAESSIIIIIIIIIVIIIILILFSTSCFCFYHLLFLRFCWGLTALLSWQWEDMRTRMSKWAILVRPCFTLKSSQRPSLGPQRHAAEIPMTSSRRSHMIFFWVSFLRNHIDFPKMRGHWMGALWGKSKHYIQIKGWFWGISRTITS